MGIFSFYLRSGDGPSAALEAFELGGNEHGPWRALKMLSEHPSCAYVAVWADDAPAMPRDETMRVATSAAGHDRISDDPCELARRASIEAQKWVAAYAATGNRTELLRLADGVQRSFEDGALGPEDPSFWQAVTADLRRRAIRGI